MYSTCNFCHAPLGKNEALEHFPVGKRLAFDQEKGRLWVVCPTCRQWNLSPLEERWEAIEEGERLYRDTRKHVATEQIGLATLRDGTELLRIGKPLRPEFAAWRYGPRFRTRHHRAIAMGAAGVVLYGAFMAGMWVGWSSVGMGMNAYLFFDARQRRNDYRKVVAHGDCDGVPISFTRFHFQSAGVVWDPEAERGWAVEIPYFRGHTALGTLTPGFGTVGFFDGRTQVDGSDAVEAMRRVLPELNRRGGSARSVSEAADLLERSPSLDALLQTHAAHIIRTDRESHAILPPVPLRLALEMAMHEDFEREALRSELAALEASWRDAEAVAAIADDLTLPERLMRRLDRIRGD